MLRTWSLVVLLAGVSLSGALACQPTPETKQLRQEILAHYEAGRRDAGHKLLARFDYASTWAAHDQVTVTAVFDSRERGMTLFAERKPGVSSSGDMLIAIPPGTRFIPQGTNSTSRKPQDLILARGAVILMGSLHSSETEAVQVLCSSYKRSGPDAGVRYSMQMARPDTPLDRVGQAVCSGKKAPAVQEAALAVWIASGSTPSQANLATSSYRTFHTPRRAITDAHIAGARRLMERGGLRASDFSFFGESGPQKAQPAKRPQPSPEPQADPAPATGPTG